MEELDILQSDGLNNVLSDDKHATFRRNAMFLNFDAIGKILAFRGNKTKVQTNKTFL
jgi:hypothetical protein